MVRAKSKIRSHVVLQSERPRYRMFVVGANWLARREYRTVREVLASYERVTRDDIADVLSKYPLTASTTVAVGPLDQVSQIVGGQRL